MGMGQRLCPIVDATHCTRVRHAHTLTPFGGQIWLPLAPGPWQRFPAPRPPHRGQPPAIQFSTVAGPLARFVFVYAGQAQADNAPSCPAYVRPNKLQGHCVTCRNFQSTLSNAIKSCWTCRNINLTFYCPGRGPRDRANENP
ncbi:PREDICTED: LOW QUALITY PROTEIN: uncharacterized protein LOC108619959 [Drosophila arizonae]|uniref:LOW QUALITY PROTEIN: uncharacterized protein LOC108619959 n=1 Tax=Drosophila arizonae TaxID=7263 RepID=A0ABM1PYP1_DROAR|nr:PREDICTED: LOW QUALITY PROTEIN: uncharacterized protein LOC108619959 [Drosophila arizonae]